MIYIEILGRFIFGWIVLTDSSHASQEGGGWYPGMEQIADSMGQLWGSFARQGSPALPSGEGPVWAPLEAGGALDELPTLVLNDADGLTLDRGYRTQLCQFWTSALG